MKALIAVALGVALGFVIPASAPRRTTTDTSVVCTRGTVPNVLGLSGEDAQGVFNDKGFKNVRLAYDKSGPYELQRVNYQNPSGGVVTSRCNEVFVALSE